jgi:hypothetical protein
MVSTASFGSKLTIDLEDKKLSLMPASDLEFKNGRIDEVDALELKKNGSDISYLNPYKSNLWQNKKHKAHNYDKLNYPKIVDVKFKKFKSSPREIFRTVVIDKEDSSKQYVITASLDNHTNILRASLLRQLGYDLDVPKLYHKMKISFDSTQEKEKFIENVGEQTLTKRDKWIIENSKEKEIIVKGFTLEPVELRNVNVHLPVMSRSRQQDRRVFRSLLNVYMLTDFTQKVNSIGWKVGRLFNNKIIFNHPYAREFKNTTGDDLRWIQRRINSLSRTEINKSLSLARYPQDIHKLLLEKLLSRINKLSEYYSLDSKYIINTDLSYGNVSSGKLTKANYPKYVVEFHKEDPQNPYRFSEVFRLFKTQIMYSTVSGLLDSAIQKYIPGIYTTDAVEKVQSKIVDFRKENPSQNGVLPLKAFSSPIVNGRVFTNRNIVFGQYLGSNAPIQLVDSVGAEVSLGLYTTLTGVPNNIMPGLNVSASMGRTYIHVRAMPDLKTASKQSLKKLFVPNLLKSLGRVIKDEYECSVPETSFVEESELNGKVLYYVKYDRSWQTGKADAIKLRQGLIDSGISKSQILLIVIKRDTLCVDQIATTRKESMNMFLKQFAANETFIINDSVRIMGNMNAPIPVPTVPGLTISLGTEHNMAILKSVMLRKTTEGIEVTVSNQKDVKNSLKEGLNYFVELLSNSNQIIKGKMQSKVYKIQLEELDEKQRDIALKTLRQLFVSNIHQSMIENYKSTNLDHRVLAKLRGFKLLWFKSDKMKMDHTVDVLIPNKDGQEFTEKQRTRKLYSTFVIKRKGNDFHSFLDRAVNSFSGFLSIGSNNGDPGQTFMGQGSKTSYITESELTKNFPLNPTTRIEFSWTGWSKKTKKLEKYFRKIEDTFRLFTSTDLIDRSLFNASPRLRSYDIKSTLILYPEAFDKIKRMVIESREAVAINSLYNLYGKENWKDFCIRSIEFFGERGPQEYYGERKYDCVPSSVQSLLKLRHSLPEDRKKLTNAINKLYINLFKNFDKAHVLKWIGKENFFASNRVTGFREKHHIGFIEYISDTVGVYNLEHGTGLFDKVGSHIGVSPYELRAMNYTPGM